jgi:hypothetical protein
MYNNFWNATFGTNYALPFEFNALSNYTSYTNSSNSLNTTIVESYNCTALQPKAPIAILVAVLVGCYALLKSGFGVLKFLVGWRYKPREKSHLLAVMGS